MQQREKSSLCVRQSGAHFRAPQLIAGYKASQTCALAAGCQIFMVSASVSRHETVLQFFLTCSFTVCVFDSLQDAHLGVENEAMRCDLLFFDVDSCADVVSAYDILVRLQAAVPELPVIVGSVSIDAGQNNSVLNYLFNTVVCLPTDDRGLLRAVAVAVAKSLH